MIAAPLTLLLAKVTLLLVLALALDALLRRRAALALSGVWNAVLLVLMLFPMASSLAPHWYWEIPAEAALTEAVPIRSPAMDVLKPLPEAPPQGMPVSEQPALSTSRAVAPGTLPQPFLSASTLSWTLTVAYCLGAGLLLVRLLAAWLAVRALRRDAITIATGIWADGLKDTQAALALARPVRLVQSEQVRVPSALGIWDRAIVIPAQLAATLDRGLVHAVLTHELAHMTRGDLAWQLLQRLVEAMLWFHPLVWLASRRIAFIRERACDEFVVHALGDANAYAQTLVELASGACRRQMLVCGLAVVRSSNLERRLNALLNSKGDSRLKMARPIRWSLAGASCLVALVLGCVEVTRAGAGKQALDSVLVESRVWREWAHLRNHENLVFGVAFAPSGKLLATAGADGAIRLWDAATLKEKRTLRTQNGYVLAVCFSPDARTVATGGHDGFVRLWDVATGNERMAINVDRQVAVSLAFSPDGKTIAMGGGMGTISCWDVQTGKNMGPGFARGIQGASGGFIPSAAPVAFSPDGKLLAAGLYDKTVVLWDLTSGYPTILEGHTGPVFSVAFTPDGKVLVSGAGHGDGSIKIWDVAAKKEIGRCEAGGGEVHSLAVTPDGRTVAAGAWRSDSKKSQVELWDLTSRKRTLIVGSTREGVGALTFSPSGEALAATSGKLYFGFRSRDEMEADWRARGEVVLWHRVKGEAKAETPQSEHAFNGKPLTALIDALDSNDDDAAAEAAKAIGNLGPQAKTAAPVLVAKMNEQKGPSHNLAAGAALWKVDRALFTRILNGDEKQPKARWTAVLSLTWIGADAKELAPLVFKIAADKGDSAIREHALLALGFIDASPADTIPVLTNALQDKLGQYGRMLSAQALGHLGDKAKDALPVLYQALADPDPQVPVDAAYAVWEIEHEARKVVPVLVDALKGDGNSAAAARERAVRRLGDIGPEAKAAVPALRELWKIEQGDFNKREIAKALKAIDANAGNKAPADSAPKRSSTQNKQEEKPSPKPKDDPRIRYQTFTVTGRAVDAGGKPVAGATIFLVSTNNSPHRLLGKTTTDTEGRYAFRDAQLPYPVSESDDVWEQGTFQIFGKSPGHAFSWAGMKYLYIDPRFADRKNPPSTESFFPTDRIEIGLEFGPRKKIDGRIVNEKGEPIAGVKVRMGNCDYVDKAGREKHQNFREFWAIEQAAAVLSEQVATVTDDQGRFQFSSVPPEVICWLRLEHPDYAHMSLYTSTAENPPALHNDHPVLKLPLQLVLSEVRTITVQVRSEKGDRPMAGYRVFANQQRASGSSSNGTSDQDGWVTLKLPPGKYELQSDPPRESDHIRTIQGLSVNNAPTQSIVLRQHAGCTLILKAVDAVTGQGISKVKFLYEFQRNARMGVVSNTAIIDYPHTNDKGELRAVVVPGHRRYWASDPFPAGYELDDRDDLRGRELELPAGKTVTVTFKLRLKQ